jgi:hypothetical protein
MSGCCVPPVWTADLHIHSRYSRACSKDLELPTLAWWARRKGVALLGTFSTRNPLVWLLGLLIVAAVVVTGLVAWRRGAFDTLTARRERPAA